MNFWYWFVSTGWLYIMVGIGIFTAIWLAVHWKKTDWLNRLGAIAIIVLVLHVIEEWVLPGGFHYIYNVGSATPDRYPMNQLSDMITNFGAAIVGLIVLLKFGFNKASGIAISIFSLFETVIHIVLAAKSLNAFSSAGQTTFYAPGLMTGIFCFLPLAVTYILFFVFNKDKPKIKSWAGGLLALAVLSFLLVNLPEMLLKNENSPYVFTYHGWYEQFINGTAVTGMSGGTIASIIVGCLLIACAAGGCIYYFGIKKKKLAHLNAYFKDKFNIAEVE